MYFDRRAFVGVVLDSPRGNQRPRRPGYNDRPNVVHDQPRLTQRFAQSTVRNGIGLVPVDELFLLHCHALGICRSALFYKGYHSQINFTIFKSEI